MYLVFTRMPGESYHRRLRSLLHLCYVFRALINSLECWVRWGLRKNVNKSDVIVIIVTIMTSMVRCPRALTRGWFGKWWLWSELWRQNDDEYGHHVMVMSECSCSCLRWSRSCYKHTSFNITLFIRAKTQSANFRGNPLCQAAERHLTVKCKMS